MGSSAQLMAYGHGGGLAAIKTGWAETRRRRNVDSDEHRTTFTLHILVPVERVRSQAFSPAGSHE